MLVKRWCCRAAGGPDVGHAYVAGGGRDRSRVADAFQQVGLAGIDTRADSKTMLILSLAILAPVRP
jgi:hypothetical protein